MTPGSSHRRRIALVVIAVLAIAMWWGRDRLRAPGGRALHDGAPATHRTISQELREVLAMARARRARLALPAARADGEVTIGGRVIDIRQQQPVGDVEVVFRSPAGDTSTTTRKDGSYSVRIAAGLYRAFVRDDTVLSIGRPDLVRLPSPPSPDAAGVPDEALMVLVVASEDTDGVDLSVVRGGIVSGHVIDRGGRPIAAAVVRALGTGPSAGIRPALATDIAESDQVGNFELHLPAGAFLLEASHPRFAGVASNTRTGYTIAPGAHLEATLTLAAGCVISGRVVGRTGEPAGDGAIEKQWGPGELQFTAAGRIDPDGTFRWVTTDEADVTLRAWPWMSPPSPSRRFTCRDGTRFDDVVFQLSDRRPDIDGVLVDKAGQPVGFAFVDLAPLDPGGIGQQERTDAAGRWAVYNMPVGHYRVTAQAEGRGITTATIASPQSGVRLELGGTGRLEGTTTRLASGSFELVLGNCLDATGMVALAQARRLVTVTGGRFAVDDLPACELSFGAIWRGRPISQHVTIPNGGTGHVEIDVGPPHPKAIHGVVRDDAGAPVAGAVITASQPGDAGAGTRPEATATTDAAGAYTMKASSGATLTAVAHGRLGVGMVGGANIDSEQVDLIVTDEASQTETEDRSTD